MAIAKTPLESEGMAWLQSHGLTPERALKLSGAQFGTLVKQALDGDDDKFGKAAFGAFQWARDAIDDPNGEWLAEAEAALDLVTEYDWEDDDLDPEWSGEPIEVEWKDPE